MYSRKKSFEETPKEPTPIWSCTADDCKGWMRDNFSFDHAPACQLCNAPMEKTTRELPVLINTNTNSRDLKKGISID